MLFQDTNYTSLEPRSETYFTPDDTCEGLWCQVAPTGRRTWVLRYTPPGGKQTEVRLGPCGSSTKGGRSITEARKLAMDLKAGNLSPADFRMRAPKGGSSPLPLGVTTKARTVIQLVDAYMSSTHSKEWVEKTETDYRGLFKNHLIPKVGTRIAKEIRGGEAALILAGIEKDSTRRQLMGLAGRAWDYLAVLEDLDTRNPWEGHGTVKGNARTRTITDEELPLFKARLKEWDGEERYKIAIQIFMETGLRHENIAHTRWEWVNLENRWIKLPQTAYKRGERKKADLYIALTDHAVALLRRLHQETGHTPYLYPGKGAGRHAGKTGMPMSSFRYIWESFLKGTTFEDLWIHDLRRSLISRVASQGDKAYASEILGHVGIEVASDIYAITALVKLREILEKAAPIFRI